MKKFIFLIAFLLMIVLIDTKEKEVLISEESLRFRVIANSDSKIDQEIKEEVAKNLEPLITSIPSSNLTESVEYLNNKMNQINKNITTTLEKLKVETKYNVNLGHNYFPEKVYKGVKYKEGNYESLVVTLGEGKGKNWWCVLYPPLCNLEKDQKSDINDAEYRLYIKEILNKY